MLLSLMTDAALLLTWGQVFTVFNTKYSYMIGVTIFELGSLICAVARTSGVLIAGRVIAGFGCAGLVNGCFT